MQADPRSTTEAQIQLALASGFTKIFGASDLSSLRADCSGQVCRSLSAIAENANHRLGLSAAEASAGASGGGLRP